MLPVEGATFIIDHAACPQAQLQFRGVLNTLTPICIWRTNHWRGWGRQAAAARPSAPESGRSGTAPGSRPPPVDTATRAPRPPPIGDPPPGRWGHGAYGHWTAGRPETPIRT